MKIIYLLFLSVSLVLASCSENKNLHNSNVQELHISIGAAPQSLDPHVLTGVPELKVLAAISEPLVKLNLDTMTIEPATAESWEISESGLIYTFKIRQTAHWSDGSAVTAHDFVFSWQRALMAAVAWQYATDYYVIKGAEEYHQSADPSPEMLGVTALNDHTLQFELNYPAPLFLSRLSSEIIVPIQRQALLSHGEIDQIQSDWTLAENYISNGPFVLKTWELNKVLIAEKNPYYWDKENVRLEKVHIYPLETESAEERAYRSGQIQVAFGGRIPVNKIATYREQQPNNIKIQPAYGIYNYLINTTKAPFDDARVRQALSHAIDRQAIVDNITKAGEIVATSITPPTPGYSELLPDTQYDLAKAKQLLADAGFPNGEGFPSFSLLYNTSDVHRKIALAIQQMWKINLGIDTTLENQEWKVYLDTRQSKNYDVSRAGSISLLGDPIDFLESYITGHGMNDSGWSNTEYDRLIKAASTELNQAKRSKLLAEAEKILLQEAPTIPIYYYVYSYLVADNVKGLHINPLSRIDYKSIYIETDTQ